ncbi:MAG TPA: response regulator transcription factor [Opitutales bacterium]|jgi:DNA-binding NarL/FixJ family response regulator|nr:response regulator transcription factor [Opitutales bacterium]
MNAAKQITVLLAEDHVVVREGLSSLLNVDGGFRILGEARTGRQAVELALELRPQVILMDIALPMLNGLEATKHILVTDPAAKVLILSAHSDDEYVVRAIAAGAIGFLEKQSSAKILIKAIQEVAKGNVFYSPTIAKRQNLIQNKLRDRNGLLKPHSARLTSRETEVLQLIAEGSTNRQIGSLIGISVKTVEKHRQHLMDKLHIHDTAGLTRYAIAIGVIETSVVSTIV